MYSVYTLTDENNAFYVGITKSGLKSRMASHRHRRDKNKDNYKLYNYWRKHELTISLIATNLFKDDAILYEANIIEAAKRFGFNVLNMTEGGELPLVTPDSIERGKISRAKTWSKKSKREEAAMKQSRWAKTHVPNRAKEVVCLDTGECFPSLSSAARYVGTGARSILGSMQPSCVEGYNRTCKGLRWSYVKESE